ncbi:MAG: sulfatase [Anaerolineaceae bacterium]|nr:sulfatase [Anaerolineaceae bacterium]
MVNLVLIDCHDLGQHLGCYGWETVPSPHLDALAARGVRFANSFCTAPQCSPSRAGLYTGRYAHANGMMGLAHHPFSWRLHDDEVHLARYLRDAGYHTVQMGVQHVTDFTVEAVQQLGFADVWVADDAAAIGEHAVAFLRGGPEAPFFLNIGFFEPHRDDSGSYRYAPPDRSRGVKIPPYLPQTPEAETECADLQGVIGKLDRAVGQIWATLEESGLLAQTWFIFTVDHGLAMPRAKCTLYDPGIETALLMYGEPFGLTGGRVMDSLTSNVDLVPTVLEMLGIPVPERLHGQSFAALLRGTDYAPREQVFMEKTFHTDYEPQRGIRTGRYKLIWNAEVDIINVPSDIMHSPIYPQMIEQLTVERPPLELYDLEADPLEQHNRIDDPAYAAIADDLRGRLLAWMRATDDPLLNGPVASPYHHRALALLRGEHP